MQLVLPLVCSAYVENRGAPIIGIGAYLNVLRLPKPISFIAVFFLIITAALNNATSVAKTIKAVESKSHPKAETPKDRRTNDPFPGWSDEKKCDLLDLSDEGQFACQRLIGKGQGTSDTYCKLADHLRRNGKVDEAMENYNRALSMNPRNSEAINGRGVIYNLRSQYDSAIASFSEAMEMESKNAVYVMNRARVFLNKHEIDSAIKDFSAALEIDSGSNGQAYYGRGLAYFHAGKFDEALSDFSAALRVDPDLALAYRGKANTLLKLNKEREALSTLNEYVAQSKNSAESRYQRGLFLLEQGQDDRAIADFDEVIRQMPNGGNAYVMRSQIRMNNGEFEKAAADIDEALRKADKPTSWYYRSRGIVYLEQKDYDRAIESFEKSLMAADSKSVMATDSASQKAQTLLWQADTYRAKRDFQSATADLDRALELQPDFGKYVAMLRGLILLDKQQPVAAVEQFNHAIDLGLSSARLYLNRGLAFEHLGDLDKARENYYAASRQQSKRREIEETTSASLARERFASIGKPSTSSEGLGSQKIGGEVSHNPIEEKRIALVIGNSAYENGPSLPNPENDARLVADILKRIGFQSVTLQVNLRKESLIAALRSFATLAETADWAVVYYAGHGMEVGGINYLVPVDAQIAVDRDIAFEAVPLDQVLNASERAKKLRLVVLDACRNNPFRARMKRTLTVASRSVNGGLAPVEPDAGTLVVYAAKDGEEASDGDGINSPFTTAFARDVVTPGLEVRRLFDFVRDDVMDATGRTQRPFSYGSISGKQDFYFVPK